MNDPIIRVQNLSKRYQIGTAVNRGEGLRHVLENALRSPQSWMRRKRQLKHRNSAGFWALKGVDFEVNRGEMIGIIGRNGAGKSTLLKLLSRITEPTTGKIVLRGRVSSLLEVGTGFHPELTGRENIQLNGAILGMSRAEIRRRFDEIVEFAGIGKFLETPVKRYSSGMYVRLAFAVAAHLEPDVLIVDEVLAVGDAEFQRKCLGKMEDVANREGRTVVLVSHQMPAIQNLCKRCILMEQGEIVMQGSTHEVVRHYLAGGAERAEQGLEDRIDRQGKGDVRVTSIDLRDVSGRIIPEAISGEEVVVSLSYRVLPGIVLKDAVFCVEICKDLKKYFSLSSELSDPSPLRLEGEGRIDFHVPEWPLMGGQYHMNFYVGTLNCMQDHLTDAAMIVVSDGDFYGSGRLHHQGWHGVSVLVKHAWRQHENYPRSPQQAAPERKLVSA
jgi:lipopolysaccharide transport system ATP-binding protein